MGRLDVVLVHAHADVGRVDLDQFRQRIEQPPPDGNRRLLDGVAGGQFFAAQALVE